MKKMGLKIGILQGEFSSIAGIERNVNLRCLLNCGFEQSIRSVNLVSFLSSELEHSNRNVDLRSLLNCRFEQSIRSVNLFADMDNLLLTAMAIDRDTAIRHPLHYALLMTPCRCALLVAQIPSAQGKKKALATCSSHLSMVILFYISVFATYLKSPSASHASGELGAAIMYALVTPTLNPFIYSLRNKDVKSSLKRILSVKSSWD
ncbi:hypothetical protein E5288_WYG005244 [Bos mutus]|uniref:G-protein coupled receptors family 1 profile domain-containing protein n=1 Tax=Bos mutus TaxID=72004 RepID=A0A6B0S5B9_9CETA|nr:hypothetical protein [Bos mutus]